MDDSVIGYSHIQLSCVIPTCFPKWLNQVTFPSSGTQKFTGLSIFLNIVRKTVRLSSFASLAGVKWYLLETLICISLLTKDTEHLYIYLFGIPIFSSRKCLFVVFFCICLTDLWVPFTYSRYYFVCHMYNKHLFPIIWIVISWFLLIYRSFKF